MTRRLLDPAEWPRLAGTSLDTTWRLLRPGIDHVLVVEDMGQIVGCWAFLPVYHAEGVWVAESHRGHAAVGRHLWLGLREFAEMEDVSRVWTGARANDPADPIAPMLLKHGAEELSAMRHFTVPMTKGDS